MENKEQKKTGILKGCLIVVAALIGSFILFGIFVLEPSNEKFDQQQIADSLAQIEQHKKDSLQQIKVKQVEAEKQQQELLQKKQQAEAEKYAYICASGNSIKWHTHKSCRGLTRCKADVNKVLRSEAKQYYDPCKFCH